VNFRIARLAIAAVIASAIAASIVSATVSSAAGAPADGPPDQLWLVSTRQLPLPPRSLHQPARAPRLLSPPELTIRRYGADGEWTAATLADLVAARDRRYATAVLVHGNGNDEQRATDKGVLAFGTLAGKRPGGQPVRLILWTWPADYLPGGFRHDARWKAERTEADAYYLAQFLEALHPSEAVTLVGYSFGARIITGALHLLGGGELDGRAMAALPGNQRAPRRAVLVAAAIDDGWLLPGRRHGRAIDSVERMVVLVNRRDRVLRWYRLLDGLGGPMALGARGLPAGAARQSGGKLVQIDVNEAVGSQHRWLKYIGSERIVEHLRQAIVVDATRRTAGTSRKLPAGG
jgi:hypothetical protein